MKQTAVEWYGLQIGILISKFFNNEISKSEVHFKRIEIEEQAKEMEKEQQGYSEEDLEKAFKVGFTLGYGSDVEAIDDKDKCFNRWFKIFKKQIR